MGKEVAREKRQLHPKRWISESHFRRNFCPVANLTLTALLYIAFPPSFLILMK